MNELSTLGIGIIGCGGIGHKRALALGSRGNLIACLDKDIDRAKSFSVKHNCKFYRECNDLLNDMDIDLVIIATTHDSLAEITHAAALAGKHVLVEKPAARSQSELKELLQIVSNSSSKVRVGFNHRYHRAIVKAKSLIDSGALGELMFLRARYGHGGRLGYDKEWRANHELSGGGELIDQGAHVIDLSRYFLGEFSNISGYAHTYFWNMSVDDNAFMILRNELNQVAFLHVSCTEWKNTFSMEVYGKNGKIEITGLGGSYGAESVTYYRMLPEMGPPETIRWEFPFADNSWGVELNEFYDDILLDRKPKPGLEDASIMLGIVGKIYKDSGYDYST